MQLLKQQQQGGKQQPNVISIVLLKCANYMLSGNSGMPQFGGAGDGDGGMASTIHAIMQILCHAYQSAGGCSVYNMQRLTFR